MDPIVYKIVTRSQWEGVDEASRFNGAPIDHADGYIHLSTADQVRETARKHFSDEDDCLLVGVDTARLGEALVFEPSRGGALFPHLYGPLPVAAVAWIEPLPLDRDGCHVFPEGVR